MKKNGIWDLTEAKREHAFSLEFAQALAEVLDPNWQVNDFGCGPGFYAQFLKAHNFEVFAYEGTEEINKIKLMDQDIIIQDLTKSFDIDDIAQTICLEVGEHIPKEFEEIFLENICENTENRLVLSWGIPGQKGFGHVNCQSNEYIINKVKDYGFLLDEEHTNYLRSHYGNAGWFEKSVMVFNRIF